MRELNYKFVGLQNYEPIQIQTEKVFEEAFLKKNSYFNMAVAEAVVNAAKYAMTGLSEAEVAIKVILTSNAITVRVSSKTIPFDAKSYQRHLRELANDPKYSKLQWGDYTGTTELSRGFWYMLQAVEYLVVAEDGSYVELSTKIPYEETRLDTSISFLVPKFLVDTGGVRG